MLWILLTMSLIINGLQFWAYVKREIEIREILAMREKLQKAKASLARALDETPKKKGK